jgi:release factor glutamine methyltransferase
VTTVHERVAAARRRLEGAGIGAAEAAASARVLAEHVLGWDAVRYLTSGSDPEAPGFAERYGAAIARRAAREPSAYIIGRQEFWSLPFEVTPAVLIPRPETELIVEAMIEVFGADRTATLAIVDACTGCGNLAVALAHEFPNASIVATDISAEALVVAERNAVRLEVAGRVRFVRTGVLEDVPGPFDAIVANPPYVRQKDGPALQPEVRDHEPDVALYGGGSGIEVIATLVDQAASRLRPGGYLMFEFGFGQEMAVEAVLRDTPALTLMEFRRDLQGLARTAVAMRSPDPAPRSITEDMEKKESL